MPVPAIAIHESGKASRVARSVDGNFKDALHDKVITLAFDWDSATPLSLPAGVRDLYRFLKRLAATIGAASRVGLGFGHNSVDELLGGFQLRLHRLLHWVLAVLVGLLVAGWVAGAVLPTPAAWLGIPTVTLAPLRWLATGVAWSQVAIAAGCTLLILISALRMLTTGSVRPVLVTFRSVVLLVLMPLLVVGMGILVAPWWLLLAGVAVLAGIAYVGAGLDAVLLWAAALAATVALRRRWAGESLKGLPKNLHDALRYVGEPRYRERIQQGLDKAITRARERLENERDFVVAAQGLGTVIALDSLAHSRVWKQSNRVLLVTMGSPLRRWFLTLYPGTVFPERLEALVELVARRVEALQWVNVYRPWDYMGAQLELKPVGGRDITTGIGVKRVFGHADYWQDADARLTVQHGLVKLGKVQPVFVAQKESIHHSPKPQGAVRLSLPSLLRTPFKAGVVLAVAGWILWWVATGTGVFMWGAEPPSELLERRGFTVEAEVTHRREAQPRDAGVTFVDYWVFAFTDSTGAAQRQILQHDVSDAYLGLAAGGFDARALTRQIRAGCDTGWIPPWLPVGDMEAPCTRDGIRLRYYSGDMTVFDLPDLPQRRFGAHPLRDWTEAGAMALVLSLLALIPVRLGFRAFEMVLG